jgi:hypothetical protein
MSTDGFWISRWLILQILWVDGSFVENKVAPKNQAALVDQLRVA